jgi:hypothetical protein
VKLSRARSSDPAADGFERYVGLEHLDPGDLKVRRWGNVEDGTTFTSIFRAGQVLFGKRRAYQRKVALADFDKAVTYALAEDGKQYALYLFGGAETNLTLTLPSGTYRTEWIDPLNGELLRSAQVHHEGGAVQLGCPGYEHDIALRVVRE